MLSKKILENLSEQMNKEIYSGYFYLGMSDYAASTGLGGFANWFYAQWKEEIAHAKVILNYINKNGQRAMLKAIDEPPQDFTSGQDLFEKTLAHEKKVTGLIKALVELARTEKDTETENFLQWFVKEQREEESTPAGILEEIKKAGEKGIKEIDKKLSARK
ncbi:MAG: ferritin [Candidatus Omnitrophica bacterium]|nr:ferritin [Candidatus Omnitrophota bacterium]